MPHNYSIICPKPLAENEIKNSITWDRFRGTLEISWKEVGHAKDEPRMGFGQYCGLGDPPSLHGELIWIECILKKPRNQALERTQAIGFSICHSKGLSAE